MQLHSQIQGFIQSIEAINPFTISGRISGIKGNLVECTGISNFLSIGSRCEVFTRDQRKIIAEVVGFKGDITLLMPFVNIDGLGIGCKVAFQSNQSAIYPHESWCGRIINAYGEAIDDKGQLINGDKPYLFKSPPPPAYKRKRVGKKLDLGIKAMNSFLSCCIGQRMGIFAGSGVGKSVLISMLTRYADTDIKVIGLIGERGREVQEFLEDYLGPEGLKKAVIIVATGDESALMRRQAGYLTLSIAEYFRDQGKTVLCLMDSVTRFAMAQREIGLASGEPPTTKAYPPSVFSELPQLLERAGPGVNEGSITGLFSVLVEGDDTNEPIADTVRGILDGHIILSREIAERGRLPAIDVLKSVSRTMPNCNTAKENELVARARTLLATYNDMAEMIKLGAYRAGSNPEIDEAINYYPKIEKFLSQLPHESVSLKEGYRILAEILGIEWVEDESA
jgi:flagellum-specific ATP synthase